MKFKVAASAAFALAVIASTPARADIVEVNPSSIQGANLLFNGGTQTDTTVFGATQGGTQVQFTGTTAGGGTTIMAHGGQAKLTGAFDTSTNNPNDTLLLTSLAFSLVGGGTFNNLEFNLFGGSATGVSFTLFDNGGQSFNFAGVLGNGENRFGFQGIDGQSISSVSMLFTGGGVAGIDDLRQLRLDEVFDDAPTPAVPEPATWALMILGFGTVGGAMRSTRRKLGTATA